MTKDAQRLGEELGAALVERFHTIGLSLRDTDLVLSFGVAIRAMTIELMGQANDKDRLQHAIGIYMQYVGDGLARLINED